MIQDRVVAEYEKVAGEPVKTRLQFHQAVSYKAGARGFMATLGKLLLCLFCVVYFLAFFIRPHSR